MANKVFYMKNKDGIRFDLYVQGAVTDLSKSIIYTHKDENRIKIIAERLDKLFKDPKRDLDFIAPGYVNGVYIVSCPIVKRGTGVTYTYKRKPAQEELYNNRTWNQTDNTTSENQCNIITISTSEFEKPWVAALEFANKLRNNIETNPGVPSYWRSNSLSDDIVGQYDGKIMPLPIPLNQGSTVSKVIIASGKPEFGCIPGQGSKDGFAKTDFPYWKGVDMDKIDNIQMANNEVCHCNDLVIAVNPDLYKLYGNKFVKVTNNKTGASIIARVTDITPKTKQFELYLGVWRALGYPGGKDPDTGAPIPNDVKLELMGN